MWILVLIIIGVIFFIGKVIVNTQKDKTDLIGKSLDEKFEVIVGSINDAAFDGEGNVRYLDKTHFTLYPETSNQIVEFLYSQGMLSITWKYKYFQKEMVYRRNFNNTRNLSLFEQQKIAESVIQGMAKKIQIHQKQVTDEI